MSINVKFIENNGEIWYSLYRVIYYRDVDKMDNINMEINKKDSKNVKVIIVILLLGLLVLGGTYAYLTFSLNVTNGNYTVALECFKIDYSIDNDDGTQDISGILFPSASVDKGLSGKVSIGIKPECHISGVGSINLSIDSGSSTILTQTVADHCENPSTLETLDKYKDSTSCSSAGGTWVTGGSGLKYAVYNNDMASGDALSMGYITNSDIGSEITIYDEFDVTNQIKDYYVFIWLDGYITDNTYVNQPFGGKINAMVVQNENSSAEHVAN